MKEVLNQEALRILEDAFGGRIKSAEERETGVVGPAISAMPVNAGEVQFLAEVARRYSIPLVPLGAGTIAGADGVEGSVLVRFDLMRRTRLPESEEPWIEAEPGTPWLELEDELRVRGRGLAVYPTSAPRATVGGWLAADGLGVGSFEYGWLSENVLSADVVLSGGDLRTVHGEDLKASIGIMGDTAIIVNAKLRTRIASSDTPFAVAFEGSDALLGAVTATIESSAPLWHLAFLNPAMARTRGLVEDYLLFGAYPGERSERVKESIHRVTVEHGGKDLPIAGVHRVWTERFSPVAPARPTPDADRAFVQVPHLPGMLADRRTTPLQGTVARSGEVLLLTTVETS